jgi:hypothetical protein
MENNSSESILSELKLVAKCPPITGATTKWYTLYHGEVVKQNGFGSKGGGTRNRDWWANSIKLEILRQHSPLSVTHGKPSMC